MGLKRLRGPVSIGIALLAASGAAGQSAPPLRGSIAFVGASAPDVHGEIYSVRADGSQRRNLTRHGHADISLTPSPDLRRIAFMSSRDGSYGVWVAGIDRTRPVRIARVRGEPVEPAMSWSPDGRRIAFDTGHEDAAGVAHEVWVAGLTGGRPRRIARSAINPAWSPAGGRIAFEAGVDFDRVVVASPTGRRLWQRAGYLPLWSPNGRRLAFVTPRETVAIATPAGRVVRHVGRGIAGHLWSPDGRHLVLEGGRTAIVSAATGRLVATLPGSDFSPQPLAWAPDGRRLAYLARGGIYVRALSGSPHRIARAGFPLEWSSNGGSLLVATFDGGLRLVRANGRSSTVVRPRAGVEIAAAHFALAARRVVFESHAQPAFQAYVLALGRAETLRVTRDRRNHRAPSWSPQGDQVALSREAADAPCRDCPSDIYVLGRSGGSPRRLTSGGAAEDDRFGERPSWAPDGRLIAFAREGPRGTSIRVVPAAGGPERVLASFGAESGRGSDPAWSPDGTRIAFAGHDRAGGQGIFVMRADGTDVRRVASARSGANRLRDPAWSPDGTRIAYREERTLRVVGADGTANAAVPGIALCGDGVAWSRDGAWLAVAGCSLRGTSRENADLYAVRPDGSVRRQLTRTFSSEQDPAWTARP